MFKNLKDAFASANGRCFSSRKDTRTWIKSLLRNGLNAVYGQRDEDEAIDCIWSDAMEHAYMTFDVRTGCIVVRVR